MNKKILIVEDDESTRHLLTEILQSNGYETIDAEHGKEGLETVKHKECQIIITDLEMPVMDGKTFIKQTREIDEDIIIIVTSVHKDPETIIEIMKMHIYDYIIKPFNGNDLILKIERAFEAAELRRMKKVMEKEKITKLQNQLTWFKFNENLLKKDFDHFEKDLFKSLHTNFTMGAGIGTLLTIQKMIAETAEKQGDNYVIDSNLFEVVNENSKIKFFLK